jgi:hypothetical protein
MALRTKTSESAGLRRMFPYSRSVSSATRPLLSVCATTTPGRRYDFREMKFVENRAASGLIAADTFCQIPPIVVINPDGASCELELAAAAGDITHAAVQRIPAVSHKVSVLGRPRLNKDETAAQADDRCDRTRARLTGRARGCKVSYPTVQALPTKVREFRILLLKIAPRRSTHDSPTLRLFTLMYHSVWPFAQALGS